jgi:hypothetical protein
MVATKSANRRVTEIPEVVYLNAGRTLDAPEAAGTHHGATSTRDRTSGRRRLGGVSQHDPVGAAVLDIRQVEQRRRRQ